VEVIIEQQEEEAGDEAEAELLHWTYPPANSVRQVVLEGQEEVALLLREAEEAAVVLLREAEAAVVVLLREEEAVEVPREEAVVVPREEAVVDLKEADEEVLLREEEAVEERLPGVGHVACPLHKRSSLPSLKSRPCMTMTLRPTMSCPSRKETPSPSYRRTREAGGKESWVANEDGCLPTMSRVKSLRLAQSSSLR